MSRSFPDWPDGLLASNNSSRTVEALVTALSRSTGRVADRLAVTPFLPHHAQSGMNNVYPNY